MIRIAVMFLVSLPLFVFFHRVSQKVKLIISDRKNKNSVKEIK